MKGIFTMAQIQNNTSKQEFKHLSLEERRLIETWHNEGETNREMGRRLGRHHQTIANELKRGSTTQIKGNKQKVDTYFAETGQAVYLMKRKNCGAKSKMVTAFEFIDHACQKILTHKWSPDAIVGFAKEQKKWKNKPLVSTKTLYNYIDLGYLPVKNIDLPIKLRRSPKKKKQRKHLKKLGTSIDQRPSVIDSRKTFGHWEIDSVIGDKRKEDNIILTLVERQTRYMLTFLLDDQTEDSVKYTMNQLKQRFGLSDFGNIFQTITADNGSEFSSLHDTLEGLSNVYFAHPYSSWERGTNERHNGLLRNYVPKGTPICHYSRQFIESIGDKINLLPRKLLNYKQPAVLFAEEIKKFKVKICLQGRF